MINIVRWVLIFLTAFYPFYLPVRFLTGYIYQVPILINFLIILALFITFLWRIRLFFSSLTRLDILMFFWMFYNFILSFISGSISLDFDAIRVYVFPCFVYYIARYACNKRDIIWLNKIVMMTSFLVAIFYLIEAYNVTFLHKGYFLWENLYNNFMLKKTAGEGINTSYMRLVGGGYFVRTIGFIGHPHATAFFTGIGSIGFLSYIIKYRFRVFWGVVGFSVCFVALACSMARVSIFVILIGYLYVLYNYKLLSSARTTVFFCGTALITLFFALPNNVINIFLFIGKNSFSGDNLVKTADVIFSNSYIFKAYYNQIALFPFSLFTGIGFGSLLVSTDDFHLLEFISGRGLFGLFLYSAIIFCAYKQVKINLRLGVIDKLSILFSGSYVLLLPLTLIHSGTFDKIQLSFINYLLLGLISLGYKISLKEGKLKAKLPPSHLSEDVGTIKIADKKRGSF